MLGKKERVCPTCNKVFELRKPSSKQVHCNIKCRSKYFDFKCQLPGCGKPFKRIRYEVEKAKRKGKEIQFCSRNCARQNEKQKKLAGPRTKKGKIIPNFYNLCEACGSGFISKNKKAKYCSNNCRYNIRIRLCKNDDCFNFIRFYPGNNINRDFCSRKCADKIHSSKMLGEGNPIWNGGISFEPYPTGWTREFRKKVREIDSFTCQICSKKQCEGDRTFHVHHIDEDKKNINIENLITLCPKCHIGKVHRDKTWSMKELNRLKKLAKDPKRSIALK